MARKGLFTILPATRAECEKTERPCLFANCKYALPLGECVLDQTLRGGMTLSEIGDVMGMSRERVRQIEASAMAKVEAAIKQQGLEGSDVFSVDVWESMHEDCGLLEDHDDE